MPIYAYRCANCGHAQDVLQKMSDAVLTVCPACGQPSYVKQVTAAGFQLKGSGWYVTDFRSGEQKQAKPAEGADVGKPAEQGGDKAAEKSNEKAGEKAADSKGSEAKSETKSGDREAKREGQAAEAVKKVAPSPASTSAASTAPAAAPPSPPSGKSDS
ncbi:MAG: zinc ribbon domain-containing protein [Pseudomonadota bacterium]|nr:zinc ribbon domain-containing protein [Pseudomonadota bacterium]